MGIFYCSSRASGGDPIDVVVIRIPIPVLPARAGVILVPAQAVIAPKSSSRASGGDPTFSRLSLPCSGIFPRGRG